MTQKDCSTNASEKTFGQNILRFLRIGVNNKMDDHEEWKIKEDLKCLIADFGNACRDNGRCSGDYEAAIEEKSHIKVLEFVKKLKLR
jgi:hypothetical protein